MRRAEYRRLLTEAYDLDKPQAPADQLAHWRGQVRRHGAPALELMSGSGRFLVPLLADGLDVDGVDASPDMLKAAERRAGAAGVALRQYEQPLDQLDLPRRYAFAFCAAGSFGLLADDAAAALERIRAHLLPGGRLLIEVETPAATSTRGTGLWTGRWWRRPDGATITLRGLTRYDPAGQVEEGVGIYELFEDGALVQTELDEWVRRVWTPQQIAATVTAAGFTVDAVTRAHTDAEATPDDELLSVLATAP